MPREDIEAASVSPSYNRCSDQLGDLAAKVFREFDNLEELVESRSTAAQEMNDHHASEMQKEGSEPGVIPCPSFNSYCCSDKLADIAVKVFGEFDNLTSLEKKTEDNAEDDDFTFVSLPKWAHKFHFGPVFPVFNRDLLLDDTHDSCQRDLEAMDERIKSTTGMAPSARLTLNELFQEVDGSSFSIPPSTSKTRRSSSACNWKLRDIFLRTNSEGESMSSSRSSKKKSQRRSWVDRCLVHMRGLCFSSS